MMTRTSIFIVLALCLVAGILTIGCTQPAAPAPVQTAVPTTTATTANETSAVQASMANPASVNCGTLNGTTEIKKNADGSEYGMCTFANGTSCEEWALFRGEGCTSGNETPAKVTAAPAVGMANPASVNCGALNGTTDIKKNADGSEYGMCTFANGTSCEEWALFRGEGCTSGNATAPSK